MPEMTPLRPSARKRGEFTFGIRKEDLLKFVPDNAVSLFPKTQFPALFEELDLYIVGARRSLIDATELIRQYIPYGLIWRRTGEFGGIEFGVYLRNKQNGETKLATQLSLGQGGHPEFLDGVTYMDEDQNTTSEVSVNHTLAMGRFREELEEVDYDSTTIAHGPIGFVCDSKEEFGYIGNTHVGVIVSTELTSENATFSMPESINDVIGWKTIPELKAMRDGSEGLPGFEPWAKLIIDEIGTIAAYLLSTESIILSDEAFDRMTDMIENPPAESAQKLAEFMARPRRWKDAESTGVVSEATKDSGGHPLELKSSLTLSGLVASQQALNEQETSLNEGDDLAEVRGALKEAVNVDEPGYITTLSGDVACDMLDNPPPATQGLVDLLSLPPQWKRPDDEASPADAELTKVENSIAAALTLAKLAEVKSTLGTGTASTGTIKTIDDVIPGHLAEIHSQVVDGKYERRVPTGSESAETVHETIDKGREIWGADVGNERIED